jgi:Tfp pilus assembly protein PilF/mono/diheme cytochrome c family protein
VGTVHRRGRLLAAAAAAFGWCAEAAAQPTYARDVAPILLRHCVACHRPGGTAPFSLLTYESARQRATQIAAATRRRVMPPWKAEPGYGEFVGLQHLSAQDIDCIARWVEAGAPEGNAAETPLVPGFHEGWQLGVPDIVVTTPAFEVPAAGGDVFRIFVIPLRIDSTRYVTGVEFEPGSGSVIHHATMRIDRTPASRRLDDLDPAPGYDGLIARSATYPDGHFLGWTPGQVPPLLPGDLAWRLDPGSDLVVQLHLQPTGRVEQVRPSIGLYFGSDAPARTPAMLRLGRQDFEIPAGASRFVVRDSFKLPVDVEVQAVQPHAHYLAREIRGTATLPDGTTRPLIVIRDWDFRWQHVYRYVTPVTLPKGTMLSMDYVYDNSPDNPKSPSPARNVPWGEQSSDEMGDLWIQVLTKTQRDHDVLLDGFRPKALAEDIAGYRMRLKVEPASVALHDDIALLYLETGQTSLAVEHFRASVGLAPESAPAQFNLGTALAAAGRQHEALERFRRALSLKPDYAIALNNLGGLLLQQGKVDEAFGYLADAVRQDPRDADAQANLGRAHRERGESALAAARFREALILRPDWAAVLADLAWVLATANDPAARDPAEAVRLAERAVALTARKAPVALDVLAAAYASDGQFERALVEVQAALRLEPRGPQAEAMAVRASLYRSGIPYRLPRKPGGEHRP